MCSIAGLIDKKGKDISKELKDILKLTKHRGPDGCGISIEGSIMKAPSVEELNISDLKGSSGLAHSRLKITGTSGTQPLTDCEERFALAFNGEIWAYEAIRDTLVLDGHKFKTDTDSEVVAHLIEDKYKRGESLADAVFETVKELDGEYAFAVFDKKQKEYILARDPVGVKQLYYGENKSFIGFCSEKKPLLKLDLPVNRVLPGEVVVIKPASIKKQKVEKYKRNSLNRSKIEIFEEAEALISYKEALFNSIKKRVKGRKKIGIIFSGGVDSVMIAQLAKKADADITCYVAGFRESQDIKNARAAASKLDLDLKVSELLEEKIDKELKNIMNAIESTNHLQVDVAIPVYFAVKIAKKDGIRVMLTGQGADELFAGYPWYYGILQKQGAEALNSSLWSDINNLYKDTLEREDKITMFHGVELRVPFLDPEVVDISMSICEKLKLKKNKVKYIHRRLAEDIGVPSFIAWRPKEAAQHGSNVHSALKRLLLKKKEFKPLVSKGYKSEDLGSAFRYAHDVYEGNEEIQGILDAIYAN